MRSEKGREKKKRTQMSNKGGRIPRDSGQGDAPQHKAGTWGAIAHGGRTQRAGKGELKRKKGMYRGINPGCNQFGDVSRLK